MATTTTLLLVLATTATLFFDLAAARCQVMMFMPGHLDVHEAANYNMKGVVRQGEVDDSKIEVVYGTKTAVPTGGNKRAIAVFGKGVKWFEAKTALNTASGTDADEADDSSKGYYIARDTESKSNIIDPSKWDIAATVTLDPRGKISPPGIEWVMFMDYDKGATATAASVYVNQAPSFRAGVTRYVNHNGQGKLTFDLPSSQAFNLDISSLHTDSTKARMFIGKGNYENAVVEMKAYYKKASNQAVGGTALTDGESFDYLVDGYAVWSSAGDRNKDLVAAVSDHVVDIGKQNYDCASVAWLAAFSTDKLLVAFYQKMMHVNDGYYNGNLMTSTAAGTPSTVKLQGTIVFGGRQSDKVLLYNPAFAANGNQNAVMIFYGLDMWTAAMGTELNKISSATGEDTTNKIYPTTGTAINLAGLNAIGSGTNHDKHVFTLKSGHKCHMVKWVAAFQAGQAYLAHRDMTKM